MEIYQRLKHPSEQKKIQRSVALREAVNYNIGRNVSPLEVLGTAEVFNKWLNENSQKEVVETSTKAPTGPGVIYPTPTVEQKKVLDEIVKRSGRCFDDVCAATLNWASIIHDSEQYPQKLESIEPFLSWAKWD